MIFKLFSLVLLKVQCGFTAAGNPLKMQSVNSCLVIIRSLF